LNILLAYIRQFSWKNFEICIFYRVMQNTHFLTLFSRWRLFIKWDSMAPDGLVLSIHKLINPPIFSFLSRIFTVLLIIARIRVNYVYWYKAATYTRSLLL